MKKSYKSVHSEDEEVWLDTGEETIRLPKEVAEYIELNGILGMA